MKVLLYKEFKLAMHPICYVFICTFPFMILIPSYPVAVGFIYLLSTYPILFLGANKGRQSNDLLFSTLLPVRKKDIVLARIITVLVMQFAYILITSALFPLALYFQKLINKPDAIPGLSLNGYVSILAIAIIGFAIADTIFFINYYKNGRSILLPTLITILGFVLYLAVFSIVIPYIPGCEWYKDILCNRGVGIQFAFLGGALVISFLLHLLTYKVSSKRLEKVDF